MSMAPIRILIADDHNLIREGLKRIFDYESDMTIVGEAINGYEAEGAIRTLRPDVVIMDVNMPEISGLQVLKNIRTDKIKVKVVILTVAGDRETLMEAVQIGADGYLLKDSDVAELIRAVRETCDGETYIDQRLVKLLVSSYRGDRDHGGVENPLNQLTPRELEVLGLMAEGRSNREVGEVLFLSEKTIKNQLTTIFRKLGVNDRVQATLSAIKWDIASYKK